MSLLTNTALTVLLCIFILSEYEDSGMSMNVSRRLDEHGRRELDNIATQMNQAAYRGMDVRARYAPADSALEARAQELFLLDQRNFAWNSRNNGGNTRYWWR